MAFDVSTSTVTTPPQVFFFHKTRMKLRGWLVVESSDGTTYNASGDQISTGNAGAGGWDNDLAWALLQDPTGAVQWLFQRGGSGDNTNWYIGRSPTAAYAGGGATTRPSAGDEEIVVASSIFLGGPYDVVSGVQTVAPWAFYVHTTNSGYPEPDVSVMYQPVSGGVGTNAAVFAVGTPGLPEAGVLYGSSLATVRNFETMMTLLDAAVAASTGSGGSSGDPGFTPTITFLPVSGSDIVAADSVDVSVVKSGSFPVSCSMIWVSSGSADSLLAWDGVGFVGRFTSSSFSASITDGSRFTIKPDAGWFSSHVAIDAVATNVSGAIARARAGYNVTDFVADSPPYMLFVPDGGAIRRNAQIVVDVTASAGLESTIGTVVTGAGAVMAFSGSVFGDGFDASSTSSALPSGRRHAIVHDPPGWTSRTFTLHVDATDAAGRTATHSAVFDVVDVMSERVVDPARFKKVYPLRRA
jgi:hypothetical protein